MPAIRASFRDGVLDLCGGTGTREGLRSLFPLIDAGHSGSVAPHWGRWPGGGVQVSFLFLFFNRKVIVLVSEEVHGRFGP